MSSDICFLLTLLYDEELLQVVLKVNSDNLPGDVSEYPMEPENKAYIHGLLPPHIQSIGPIVAVDEIFSAVDLT